ncbi:hypothetical protein TcasGA2_TC013691 [Tribolium castaneum]|uniref:Ubiquitin-like protease family profile domain-containing protein n=1 Tax=Tribolium castaneum TaxID=7070 RepID=D6WKB9_TRICA|nr:PREDICTED: uncharacterized protein LOC659719 isoform X1 [Tribolium castaneum]EFA03603.1 hypothetical protein TcasGA2_TC013691 [Tribolium castaneum]|eukprot:XP_008193256.1 PREDICTED: uncharacterized protein LOC659719 isoform X1 [Tribolium castaneum]
MAHYYHVLSQDDKSNDKVAQFYPNLEENQTVQFVIASDGSQQQFQAQPVVVSSDQLMVVEGQGQQVIIDQSQVTYQSPPYVVQETSGIEFPNNQQQVYYMTNTSPNQSVVVEQSINQQPVVLNHQFLQNQMSKANSPMHQTGVVNASVIQEKSIVQMRNQIKAAAKHNIVNKALQLTPQKMVAKDIAQNLQSSLNDNEADNNEEETVTLRDERMINYTQYRRLITQKQNQAMQERLASQNIASFQRKPRPAINKQLPRNARPKQPIRLNRNNVAFIPNASLEERYEEHKSPIKQNTSQFQNQMPQRQQPQMNRPSQVQESQNQYLIQPRQRDSKPQIQRPLPQFLHTSQIQNIIDNAPKSAEYSDSIRMLVLLDNGEQRLITFTLPKEACTIQEILEQVGVPFTKETPIQVTEANSNGLNYIVAVGNVPGFTLEPPEEITLENEFGQQQVLQVIEQEPPPLVEVSTKPPSPEPPKELPPKIIEGLLAVCQNCGYLSEDFNKCMRCKRKLPENVKSVAAVNSNGKKVDPRSGLVEKRLALQKTNGIPRMNLLPKKRPSKPKLLECETVVVSSDEEESDKKTPVKNVSEQLLEKLGASVTISPISKEPSTVDIQKSSMTVKGTEKVPFEQVNSTLLLCRTIRIGSYRFVPPEPIRVDSNGITLKVPHPKIENTLKIIKIESSDIVKVLISFQKSLPVLFYYLLPSVGAVVREALDMTPVSDYYFDPLSEIEEAHRRITLLPESLSEESKITLQKIYSKNSLLDELTYKEANDILIKTCPKELSKTVMSYSSVSEIKALLMYPAEGRGRITINTEDYMCLGQDQFLNDVIIDFYLKYLLLNLPKERQDKVHIFSTFFYKRLTTKPLKASRKSQPTEIDPNLSPAQKRHSRVKTWTKNVNIFEKDFIIVPINENCHWFLAIICFPNMNGTHTMDGQPIRIEPKQSQKKKKVVTAAVKEKNIDPSIMCEDGDSSDKDEAEGDDSELDSDDSEESPPQTLSVENNSERPPIKQPCILIFDSLAGASRSRVVATLRDYLTCEYKAKLNEEKIFTKDIIKGACPKVPQQTNFTDCGLYLLQYVEQFFNDPIKDYHIPILHLKTWFEEITVTKKREDISLLIQSLMKEAGKDLDILPDVIFPTQNGELTERALMEKEDKFMDDEMMEDEDEDYVPPMGKITSDQSDETGESNSESQGNFALKPSNEGVVNSEFTEQAVTSASC